MTNPKKAAAMRRAALFACAACGVATLASPVLGHTIDDTSTVRIANIAQPSTPAQHMSVRNRVAAAAEEACGSDSRSLPDYRYAVLHSDCFAQNFETAMQELQYRWDASNKAGGSAGSR